MFLYHVSPDVNDLSISRHGLLTARATGKRKAVWAATEQSLGWAISHVCKRHRVTAFDVSIWKIKVSKKDAWTKHKEGIAYCKSDIPPCKLLSRHALRAVPV